MGVIKRKIIREQNKKRKRNEIKRRMKVKGRNIQR
jgi:hypothetical protein